MCAYFLSRIDIGVVAFVQAKHSEQIHTPMKLDEIIQHLKATRRLIEADKQSLVVEDALKKIREYSNQKMKEGE
jgi:hypothetical protein